MSAHWISNGDPRSAEPSLSGNLLVDTLVAASVAHAAYLEGIDAPEWTHAESRTLDRIWNPGGAPFFAYAMVNAPAEFYARGLFVEEGSLVCV